MSVRRVAVQPLPASSPHGYWGTVTGKLKEMRKIFRFAKGNAVCSLPCDMAVVRALEAYRGEVGQREILRWELEAGLLGPIDEYVYDFYEVSSHGETEFRKYLAAAIREETLDGLRKALKGIKMKPNIIDIDLFAITRVFRQNYGDRLSGMSALVHGEPGCTKIIIVKDSVYVDHGVFDFESGKRDAVEYAEALMEGVDRLVSKNSDIAQGDVGIFLTGSLFMREQFAVAATSCIENCELLDPFKNLAFAVGLDGERLKTYAPQVAVAIGLALRGKEAE
jgi:Tfp pilus assembly PilM family ATPase